MKVIDERKTGINFEEVNVGQVFCDDINPYMKIFGVRDDRSGDFYNAVDLQDGDLVYFADDERVIFCNATLNIS